MTPSLILACAWVVTACVIAMLPSKRHHWPAAYVLIAAAVPILALSLYQNGPWLTLAILIAFASILRWPVYYVARTLRSFILS